VTRTDAKSSARTVNGSSHGHGAHAHDTRHAKDFDAAWRFVRGIPRAAQTGLKTNPVAVIAGVGATAFVLGALCGSKVGRVLVTTLAGYGLRQFMEGPMARELGRYATDALKHVSASA
jgi:hypothetical protein